MYKIGDKILVELEIESILETKNGMHYIARPNAEDYLRTIRIYEKEIIKDMERDNGK